MASSHDTPAISWPGWRRDLACFDSVLLSLSLSEACSTTGELPSWSRWGALLASKLGVGTRSAEVPCSRNSETFLLLKRSACYWDAVRGPEGSSKTSRTQRKSVTDRHEKHSDPYSARCKIVESGA